MLGTAGNIYDLIQIFLGSRTPHYGSQTPLHDSGSRTPAWDPSITNTPGREEDSFYDTGNFQPTTPGYSATPYTPQTPGGYASDHSFSPYNPSPSSIPYHPSPSNFIDQSPGSYQVTPSPSAYGQSPALNTGFLGQSPMTPGGFQPQTPGTG